LKKVEPKQPHFSQTYFGSTFFKKVDKIKYNVTAMNNQNALLFDVVIPIGPNDISKIKLQIQHTKKNVIGHRNIYIVPYDPNLRINGCITIEESTFPFSKNTIAQYHGKSSRNGWYLQQLLKLYAGSVIPGILDRYLVIDSDTFFLKPTHFVCMQSGKCFYNYNTKYHAPYLIHMNRLHPTLVNKLKGISGICHHMMFERQFIGKLFELVEKQHGGKPFYQVFLENVEPKHKLLSGASEYEIYFNYMLLYHEKEMLIRPLKWANVRNYTNNVPLPFDYISWHWYM
jgi:hypothetical protein